MLMPPLVQKIEPGDVIGRCRTVRELGRGGMGTVYLAEHQTLQIEVALKVLSPTLSMENPALAERFIREAQLAARIRHPNVIAVMDAAHDETTGLYFIVMEYVGGGALSWHLRNGPLPEAKALAIVTGIAHALAIAEENRIVHRDIKPDNIMLDLRGTAKLADLGLAKHALDSRLSLTIGGSYMGTPAYMSPDQARDAKIADTRDDIYSLGASFYECLTGEPPFTGETPYNIMSELLTKPSPKPRTLRPDLSLSVDLICRKMMAKTRELRYADARALLQDLELAQMFGDSRLDRLEASSLDHASLEARQQEMVYGIETSSEGVYAELEPMDNPPARKRPKPALAPAPIPRGNHDVFGAAALLIAMVSLTTLLLAWAAPSHSLSFVEKEWDRLNGLAVPPTLPVVKKKEQLPISQEQPASSRARNDHPTPGAATPGSSSVVVRDNSSIAPSMPLQATVIPVAPAANPADLTNATPAAAVPAFAALPDSAFAARDIAEKTLPPGDIAPTGKAELLKIVGDRDPTQITPTTWKFYFFDKNAAGHARIVTVNNGQVTKSGDDLVDFASPYDDSAILPEDQIQKDSTDALQIAEGLIPGVTVTSSEFTLVQQKNSPPMWKVTLWNKNANGEEHKLGDVTLVAANGTLHSVNLKP